MGDFIFGDLRTLSAGIAIGLGGLGPAIAIGMLAGKAMEAFSREEQGFFLVTRLTGYTVETALGLIEKANNSLGERGIFALDLATNRNDSGNDWSLSNSRGDSFLCSGPYTGVIFIATKVGT